MSFVFNLLCLQVTKSKSGKKVNICVETSDIWCCILNMLNVFALSMQLYYTQQHKTVNK